MGYLENLITCEIFFSVRPMQRTKCDFEDRMFSFVSALLARRIHTKRIIQSRPQGTNLRLSVRPIGLSFTRPLVGSS